MAVRGSESGGGISENVWRRLVSFWRCRILRTTTGGTSFGEGVGGGVEKESRTEMKVAARRDFWSAVMVLGACFRP